MTGQPEDVPPLARGVIPEFEQRGYKAYPLVDHVADKVAATYERHGAMAAPSTRYRDLDDLVSIASGASVEATGLRIALLSEFDRRRISLPAGFDVPDHQLWASGYAAEARRSLLPIGLSLDEALELVRRFVDPVLQGSAVGTWDSREHRWSG